MKSRLFSTLCLPLLCSAVAWSSEAELRGEKPPAGAMWLENLNLALASNKIGEARAGRSFYNNPLTLNEVVYAHGVGTGGESELTIALGGSATEFQAQVGVDDEILKMGSAMMSQTGNVSFSVVVDGRTAFDSGPMKPGEPSKAVQVNLSGVQTLVLRVTNMGRLDYGNNADWAGAFIRLSPRAKTSPAIVGLPQTVSFPTVLAPNPKPAINGPSVLGLSPNRPFLYRVPTTGSGPLAFSGTGLPSGLKLDAKTGVISGQVAQTGTYSVTITASNAKGKVQKKLSLRCASAGLGLALTPPMGWSAYEVWGSSTSDAKVREAAQWLVKSGLAAHGYRTILLGDSWQGKRDEKGNLQPNSRFPDMKALGDYLHSLGLQFGIHSAATEHTAVGSPGSLGHETEDAQQFAAWGVDYLTYEWAPSAQDTRTLPQLEDKEKATAAMEAAFSAMKEALRKTNRDIVFSITVPSLEMVTYQNRMDVAALAKKVGANVWSERNGLYDDWKVMSNLVLSKMNTATYVPLTGPVTAQTKAVSPAGTAVALGSVLSRMAGSTSVARSAPAATASASAMVVQIPATNPASATPAVSTPEGAVPATTAPAVTTQEQTIVPAPVAPAVAAPETDDSDVDEDEGATPETSRPAPPPVTFVPAPVAPRVVPMPRPAPPPPPGPGFWNYPGALMMGRVGFPTLHLSRLTPGEQMYQMSIWSLYSAPLILQDDLARLDPNLLAPTTTAMLSNDEVLDINQDALGKAPLAISVSWPGLVRAKPLADGRVAVGLFNSSELPRKIRVPFVALSLKGTLPVRDVWGHRDLGEHKDAFEAVVPAHGVVLVKVGTSQDKGQVAR